MDHVANLIKRIRKEKNLTQNNLSDVLGCEPQFISLLENRKSKLPLDHAKKIIKKYELNKADFVFAYLEDYKKEILKQIGKQ